LFVLQTNTHCLFMPAKDRIFKQELLRRRYEAGIRSPARLAHITGMTEQGVRKAIKRYCCTGSFEDAPRTGRPRRISYEDEQVLLEMVASGFEGSAARWAQELQQRRGQRVSPSALRRTFRHLQWTYRTPLIEPLTLQQKQARVAWCHLHQDDDWKRTVFLDEFSIDKERSKIRIWVSEDPLPKRFSQRKFQRSRERTSVTYLAAITLKGDIGCFELPQSFKVEDLVTCLNDEFLPRVTALLGKRWRLAWDNDARHRSSNIWQWVSSNAHDLLCFPSHSPDLNPIENLFKPLKDHVEAGRPQTTEDIRLLVQKAWKKITANKAQQTYIKSIAERCSSVIHASGDRLPL